MNRKISGVGTGLPPHLGGVANSRVEQVKADAETPEDALKECEDSIKNAVNRLPDKNGNKTENWKIEDAWINAIRGKFLAKFKVVWDTPSQTTGKTGTARWNDDGPQVRQMAMYIGILSRFYAEAEVKDKIDEKHFTRAVQDVSGNC
jgi:hypothetical protein